MERLAQLKMECNEFNILHSEPEHYFHDLRSSGVELPRFENEINPWGPGCYTSQVRIKQKHRMLENTLYQCEKMASAATIQGLMRYPKDELHEALRDLLVAEFHDILPGSSVQPVEDNGLRLMDHGLELLSRVRARAFFALAGGQPKPKDGEIRSSCSIRIHSPCARRSSANSNCPTPSGVNSSRYRTSIRTACAFRANASRNWAI